VARTLRLATRPVPADGAEADEGGRRGLGKRALQERDELLSQLRVMTAHLRSRTAELESTLQERDVLLREAHHRMKNSLQLMSSLIHMQVRSLPSPEGRDVLLDCETRLRTIALIHERLCLSSETAELPFSDYVRALAQDIFEVTGALSSEIALELAVEPTVLDVNRSIPCGLVLNELLTNAVKHAFPDGRPGTIRVELAPVGARGLRLAVADDGVGLPARFELRSSTSLGLQLVQMLGRQMGATVDVDLKRGTRVSLTLPSES